MEWIGQYGKITELQDLEPDHAYNVWRLCYNVLAEAYGYNTINYHNRYDKLENRALIYPQYFMDVFEELFDFLHIDEVRKHEEEYDKICKGQESLFAAVRNRYQTKLKSIATTAPKGTKVTIHDLDECGIHEQLGFPLGKLNTRGVREFLHATPYLTVNGISQEGNVQFEGSDYYYPSTLISGVWEEEDKYSQKDNNKLGIQPGDEIILKSWDEMDDQYGDFVDGDRALDTRYDWVFDDDDRCEYFGGTVIVSDVYDTFFNIEEDEGDGDFPYETVKAIQVHAKDKLSAATAKEFDHLIQLQRDRATATTEAIAPVVLNKEYLCKAIDMLTAQQTQAQPTRHYILPQGTPSHPSGVWTSALGAWPPSLHDEPSTRIEQEEPSVLKPGGYKIDPWED